MWHISGKAEWIPFYILLIAFLIYRYGKESTLLIGIAILSVIIADQLAVHAFKEVFQRLRPSHDTDIQHLVHIVNNYRGGLYGFVSNHAANSFALAGFLGFTLRLKYLTAILLFWAVLISYSRVYLGVHFPADCAGGALLGLLIGWLASMAYRMLSKRNSIKNREP
jgi:undecaprenyl-diphosphatase